MAARDNWSGFKTYLPAVTLAGVWCLFLWRVMAVFGPESDHTLFVSDSAFPILISNQDRPITLFDYYSYGQDRWGSLPFLLARLFHQWTGYHWSGQSMHVFRAIWLFLGLLILTSLSRRARLVVLLSALIAICLPELTRVHMFDLSELYAWQIPGLFLSWYIARRLFGTDLVRTKQNVSGGKPGIAVIRAVWGLVLFCVSFLTVWTSLASGPFLCFLVVLEAVRADLGSSREPTSKWMRGRYVFGLGLVALAMLAEKLLRMDYHRYCLKRWGGENRTSMGFDSGHLRENLAAQIGNYFQFSWWPITVIPLLLFLTLAAVFIYLWWKKRVEALQELRRILIDDTFILIVGMWGIAIMNFAMTVLIEHIRLGDYNNRFLTLTFFLGVTSGLLTLFLVFSYFVERSAVGKYAVAGFTIASFLFLVLKFPPRQIRPDYLIESETALTLAEKAPNATLMGGYWGTYVLVALQRTNSMLPLPLQGEPLRMPWTPAMLRDAKQVVVEYRRSGLASSNPVPPLLTQYGVTLRLVDPKWYANEKYAFALYLVDKK